jgi:hypothetical protein
LKNASIFAMKVSQFRLLPLPPEAKLAFASTGFTLRQLTLMVSRS